MKSLIFILVLVFVLTGCSNQTATPQNQTNANAQRLASNITNTDANINNTSNFDSSNTVIIEEHGTTDANTVTEEIDKGENSEKELSAFSTDILTDDEDRESNIKITCDKINNYTVDAGSTFSFTKTVGKATYEKGYEKADIFDANGNKTKGLRWWELPSK